MTFYLPGNDVLIALMKVIMHNYRLYEVAGTLNHLYLIQEYAPGGELFVKWLIMSS